MEESRQKQNLEAEQKTERNAIKNQRADVNISIFSNAGDREKNENRGNSKKQRG